MVEHSQGGFERLIEVETLVGDSKNQAVTMGVSTSNTYAKSTNHLKN